MRYLSIDILRTIAIVLMVMVHFMENLSGVTNWSPTGFGAPFFAFLSGVSYSLWLRGKDNKKRSQEEISKITIRRGLFLIGIGFILNFFVWLPEELFNWDVLTYIGSAILVLNWIRIAPPPIALIIAGFLCISSPIFQKAVGYEEYWTDGYFQVDLTWTDLAIGYLFTGYFPLVPWLALPIIGFTIGNYMLDSKQLRKVETNRVTMIGLGFIAISIVLVALHSYMPSALIFDPADAWRMFPPSLAYLAGTIGMTLFCLATLHRWLDHNERVNKANGIFTFTETMSRHSLTIYILHHVVHLWPLWIYGIWMGQEPTFYWGKAMSLQYSFPLVFVFVLLCYLFLRWMDRKGWHGVEYWMRRLCD